MASRAALLCILAVLLCTPLVLAEGPKCVPDCKNGGACTQIDGTDEAYCKCQKGFMGATCEAQYQECEKALVCYNGGKCVTGSNPNSQECACTPDWTGATCKVPVVRCGNNTDVHCMNGGTCMFDPKGKEWYCKCAPNVRGRHCQFGVRECKDGMYCMNDGVCSADGTTCECPASFFGLHCQNNRRDPNADRIAQGSYLPGWAIALIVIACVLAVAGAVLAGILIHRERKGTPVFKQWQAHNAAGGGNIPTTTI